jgi:hypothetical protein
MHRSGMDFRLRVISFTLFLVGFLAFLALSIERQGSRPTTPGVQTEMRYMGGVEEQRVSVLQRDTQYIRVLNAVCYGSVAFGMVTVAIGFHLHRRLLNLVRPIENTGRSPNREIYDAAPLPSNAYRWFGIIGFCVIGFLMIVVVLFHYAASSR